MIPGILAFPILPYYMAVRQARKIDGWLLNEEARFLFSVARLIKKPKVIVEVGAWHGKSTVLLCRGARTGGNAAIYSFDLFEIGGNDAIIYKQHVGKTEHGYLSIWRKNVTKARCASLARPVIGCSWKQAHVITEPVGFLFVDGDHTEDGVRRDWLAFSPHLADDAIVMFHDYLNPNTGVSKIVDRIRAEWNFGVVGTSAVLWRIK